ncbi:arabinosyltransferase C-terminal domain-containing protein, partial [Lolliginicoccus suaedae]|uniref:arabinosyltransferase C-terminal domain-containing protein n=1 Tax=Lolliginicoccus suaedae TaxID=2605429 RepID=UPI0011EF52EF
EASRLRTAIGPSLAWYEEMTRYVDLFGPATDGSLGRRFAVLVLVFAIGVAGAMLMRRGGIPGVPTGPASRMLGLTVASFLFLTLTPTKWTHHFGAFAGIGASVAAIAAVAMGPALVRSARDRLVLVSVLLLITAFAMTGTNRWWHVSNYGVPFGDRPPLFLGRGVANWLLLLAMMVFAAAALYHYLGMRGRPVAAPGWLRWLTAAPILVIAAIVVVAQVASLALGAARQYPAYSVGRSNIDAILGSPCGLANDVLVEQDPNAGLLDPVDGGDPATALGGGGNEGFTPNGLAPDLAPDQAAGEDAPSTLVAAGEADAGGQQQTLNPTGFDDDQRQEEGINGSTAPLPFGLDPARVPVLGSYRSGEQRSAELTSDWYALPERSDDRPLVAITAAGRIAGTDAFDRPIRGQELRVEFGIPHEDGFAVVHAATPLDTGPFPSWRNLRVPLDAVPADATAVRIVARDTDLDPSQWLVVTPPRVPVVDTLQDVVGSDTPVMIDWSIGLAFPCQQPFVHRNGVIDMPEYRIAGDFELKLGTDIAQGSAGGGPVGITSMLAEEQQVATYLSDDWGRDWGSLQRLVPYSEEAVPASTEHETVRRSGLWNPGPMR